MSKSAKLCPRCGGQAKPTNVDREAFEHAGGHIAAHTLKHNPIAGLLGLGAFGISKLLPRKYRCEICGHTFSA